MTCLAEVVRPFGESRTGVTFVDDEGGARRVTYDELARRAASVAAQLKRLGVRAGDAVAVAMDNSGESVAAQLAVTMAGATLFSIPPPPRREADTYEHRFRAAISAGECRLLIGTERTTSVLRGAAPCLPFERLELDAPATPADADVPSTALVQFSSGSTAAPKGIALSGDVIAAHIVAIANRLAIDGAKDRVVSWLPLYHDMGFIGAWLAGLAIRAELTLMTPRRFVRRPQSWLEACAATRATVTVAPDFAYRLAARMLTVHALRGGLDALTTCLCGAEPVSWATLESFNAAAAPHGFRWEALMPVYGLAEATLAVTAPPRGRGPTRDGAGNVGLGRPLDGIELRLRPFRDGDSTLDIRSPWLMDGYLATDGLRDPRDEDGWLPTTDIAYAIDDELFVRGRADEAIVVRGRNVFAEDVEALAMAATSQQPVGVAAFRASDDSDRFALAIEVVEGRDGKDIAHSVQSAVKGGLETQVSPVLIMTPRSIPRTTSGKVRRAACRQLILAGTWPNEHTIVVVT